MTDFYARLKELPPEKRRYTLQTLTEHLISAGQTTRLCQALTRFEFLEVLCKDGFVNETARDLRRALALLDESQRPLLAPWESFFCERAHVIRRGSAQWPANRVLVQLAIEHADDSPVTAAAERWLASNQVEWIWLRKAIRPVQMEHTACKQVLEGHSGAVNAALMLHSGSLVSAGQDFSVRLWDIETGGCQRVLSGHRGPVKGLVAIPEHRLCSWSEDATLRLWNLESAACERVLTLGDHPVEGALLLSNGELLAWGISGPPSLWNLQTGAKRSIVDRALDGIAGALELPGQQLLTWLPSWSAAHDEGLRVWDMATMRCLARLHPGEDVSTVTALPDQILVGFDNGAVWRWQLPLSLSALQPNSGAAPSKLKGQLFKKLESDDNCDRIVKLLSGELLAVCGPMQMQRWDAASGDTKAKVTAHYGAIHGVLRLASGQILSWSDEHTLKLWDAALERCLLTLRGHSAKVLGALELSDGRLVSYGADRHIRIWQLPELDSSSDITVPKERQFTPRETRHRGPPDGVCVLKNGTVISWSGADGNILFWDAQTGECTGRLGLHGSRTTSRLVSPELFGIKGLRLLSSGELLSFAYDGLRLWDLGSKTCVATSGKSCDGVILIEPDGIIAWDRGEKELRLLDTRLAPIIKLAAHSDNVTGALLLPDRTLLSYSEDGTLRRWDVGKGSCLNTYRDDAEAVVGAASLSDDCILSWHQDGRLRTWNLHTGFCLLRFGQVGEKWVGAQTKGALLLSPQQLVTHDADDFYTWQLDTGKPLEPVPMDIVRQLLPQWLAQCAAAAPEMQSLHAGGYMAWSESETICVASPLDGLTPLLRWQAETQVVPRHLFPDGTLVVTQQDGQVHFLKVCRGAQRINLDTVFGSVGFGSLIAALKTAAPNAPDGTSPFTLKGGPVPAAYAPTSREQEIATWPLVTDKPEPVDPAARQRFFLAHRTGVVLVTLGLSALVASAVRFGWPHWWTLPLLLYGACILVLGLSRVFIPLVEVGPKGIYLLGLIPGRSKLLPWSSIDKISTRPQQPPLQFRLLGQIGERLMKLQGLSPPRDETTSPDDELFSLETESPVDAGFLYATLGDREERIPVLPVRERIELVAQIQRLAKGKCDWVEEYPRLTQPRSAPTAEATRAAVAKESDDSEPRGLSNALKKALGSIEPRASGSALPSAQQCIAWLLAVVATSTYRFEATQVLYLGQLVLLYRTYLGNAFAAASLPTAVILDLFERGEAYLREPAREHFLPQLLSARSEILLQLDRRQEAIAAAEEAVAVKERHPISVGPRLASYWLNLGNLLVQDNRGTEAEPLWKKVLLDPNASPQHRQTAQAQLALLLEERGDLGASPQRL